MPYYHDEFACRSDVRLLSDREKRWIERLERCLKACPTKRLELVTIGDASLDVIDGQITRKFDLDLHDGGSITAGVRLADIEGKPLVHGVSG